MGTGRALSTERSVRKKTAGDASNGAAETRLPGRVSWTPIGAIAVVLCLIAGAIAVDFALRLKTHVALHTGLAYVLELVLIYLYGTAHSIGRKLIAALMWLTSLALTAVLVFIHLDDIPRRLVYDEAQHREVLRDAAPQLYASIALLAALMLLLAVHLLWLGRGSRLVVGDLVMRERGSSPT